MLRKTARIHTLSIKMVTDDARHIRFSPFPRTIKIHDMMEDLRFALRLPSPVETVKNGNSRGTIATSRYVGTCSASSVGSSNTVLVTPIPERGQASPLNSKKNMHSSPTSAAAGMVINCASTIFPATPQRTAENLFDEPTEYGR